MRAYGILLAFTLALTACGTQNISVQSDSRVIRGRWVGTLRESYGVYKLEYSPSKSLLAARTSRVWTDYKDRGEIMLLDAGTGQVLHRLRTGYVDELRFSSDGLILLAVGYQEVQYWDTQTGELRETYNPGHMGYVPRLSPDGRWLGIISWMDEEQKVEVWDLLKRTRRFQMLNLPVSSGGWGFSPSGELAAITTFQGSEGAVLLLDLARQTRQSLPLPTVPNCTNVQPLYAYAFQFTADGKWLAALLSDSSLVVWDLPQGQMAYRIKTSICGWATGDYYLHLDETGSAGVWALDVSPGAGEPEGSTHILEWKDRILVNDQRLERLSAYLRVENDSFLSKEGQIKRLGQQNWENNPPTLLLETNTTAQRVDDCSYSINGTVKLGDQVFNATGTGGGQNGVRFTSTEPDCTEYNFWRGLQQLNFGIEFNDANGRKNRLHGSLNLGYNPRVYTGSLSIQEQSVFAFTLSR